jgi:hypothetical protein
MHIYHIKSFSGCVKRGITNNNYKITGVKQFRLWLGNYRALPLIMGKESIERRGRGRFIELKEGEIERVGTDIVLNTTHETQKGAILFWDLSGFIKTNGEGESFRIINIGYPKSIETVNAEVVLRHPGRYCDTLLCVVHQEGVVRAIYDGSRYIALKYEADRLRVDVR